MSNEERPSPEGRDEELEFLLECAHQANWDAVHGPEYVRAGRFWPRECDPEDEWSHAHRYVEKDTDTDTELNSAKKAHKKDLKDDKDLECWPARRTAPTG